MKKLIKILPLLFLPFLYSGESKAQSSYSNNFDFEMCVSRIKPDSIAPEFKGYRQNNPDTIRWYFEEIRPGLYFKHILLNIDEDPRVDVWESEVLEENENGELVKKYEHPFGYAFFPGPQDMYYYETIEIGHEPDGPNGNELSLEKIKECAYTDKSVLYQE